MRGPRPGDGPLRLGGERIKGGQPGAGAVTCPGRSRWDRAGSEGEGLGR